MILRIDKLAIELPMPANPSPNSASAVQELLGGKFGEMSTLMNYTFVAHYHRERNHQGLGNELIEGSLIRSGGVIRRRSRFGGLPQLLRSRSMIRRFDGFDTPMGHSLGLPHEAPSMSSVRGGRLCWMP
jgi:hypothetical protein